MRHRMRDSCILISEVLQRTCSMKLQSQNQTPLQSSLKRGAARPLLLSRVMLCAVAVCACNGDAPTAVRPSVVASPRFDAGATIYPPLSANDPGINPYDTWVSQVQTVAETTTVNSTQPFDDPKTGAPVTSATIGSTPQTVNVTAGYGYNGQI